MPAYDPLNPDTDCFKPPAIPTEVCCLHCGCEYESYLIEWRVQTTDDGKTHGFWCCPTLGCDGRGFGFDILPTDPDYVGEDGEAMWSFDEDDPDLDPDLDDDLEPEMEAELEFDFDAGADDCDDIPFDDAPSAPNRMRQFFDDNSDDLPW